MAAMKALLAAALLLVPATALASDKAAVLAEFKGYVESCTANPGDRTADKCIEDQVSSLDAYLGDIVGEMTQYVLVAAAGEVHHDDLVLAHGRRELDHLRQGMRGFRAPG
jgi:hypothetical protein